MPWGATVLPWLPGHGQHEFNEGLVTPTVNLDMKWQGVVLVDSVPGWGESTKTAAMAQAKMAAVAQAKTAAMALSRN